MPVASMAAVVIRCCRNNSTRASCSALNTPKKEIDALTGPVLGMPKSATFRTLDIVGLDVLAHVVKNLRESLPQDERRALFQVPGFVEQMIQRGLLGDKTGQGFYKKVKGKGR